MSHNLKRTCKRGKVRLDIVVTDRHGKVVDTRHIENDLALRNLLGIIKSKVFSTYPVADDGMKDVGNNALTGLINTSVPYQMLGSGTTAETPSDYRIQTPLYTKPDLGTIGNVSLGAGNQVTVAITVSHTFAAQTDVYEAGILEAVGSTTTYLYGGNYQVTRNTFAKVTVPAGGTFTGTYTLTEN
jgi:hypothetical protein